MENKENDVKKVTGEGLEYNTQRPKIILSQYGRNIHKLVEYAMTIKDRQKRNIAAEQIIIAMEILNPKIKAIENYKKVLWNHLAILSEYKLDVDYPYKIIPEEEIKSKPETIPIEKNRIKKRHYGRIIQEMIKTAKKLDDQETKHEFIKVILIQMKRTYVDWNKDVVSDSVIFDDFRKMSNNELKVPDNFKLPQAYEFRTRFRGSSRRSKKR